MASGNHIVLSSSSVASSRSTGSSMPPSALRHSSKALRMALPCPGSRSPGPMNRSQSWTIAALSDAGWSPRVPSSARVVTSIEW